MNIFSNSMMRLINSPVFSWTPTNPYNTFTGLTNISGKVAGAFMLSTLLIANVYQKTYEAATQKKITAKITCLSYVLAGTITAAGCMARGINVTPFMALSLTITTFASAKLVQVVINKINSPSSKVPVIKKIKNGSLAERLLNPPTEIFLNPERNPFLNRLLAKV